jgi:hypothetical protein
MPAQSSARVRQTRVQKDSLFARPQPLSRVAPGGLYPQLSMRLAESQGGLNGSMQPYRFLLGPFFTNDLKRAATLCSHTGDFAARQTNAIIPHDL